MMTPQMDTVIRHLRRAVLRQDRAGKMDGQLLASFIDQKDDAAFEALVRRHGPMVFGVCRRVVGNHHDAEDAFQATFLVLARKASSVRPRERVANWLHGVALRTAMKAKAMTMKRRGREKQVAEMPQPEANQQDQWHDLQPLLDQELTVLPENYRLPILLCDLEGKTIKAAAEQLGWPQGSLAGRLARGRKLLARRLTSRGVVLSAGSLAVAVSQHGASAGLPTWLVQSTVKAASLVAAGQTAVAGVVPVKVAVLMEGVMKAMLITKLKTATVALLVVTVVATGAGLHSRTTTAAAQAADERVPKRVGEHQVTQTRTGSVVLNERNFETGIIARVNSDAGLAGSVVLNERNFETGIIAGVNSDASLPGSVVVNEWKLGAGFFFLAGIEMQAPSSCLFMVPFLDCGTVGSSLVPAKTKAVTLKTDLDRLQGIWLVVSIEQGGKPARLDKAVFMVDGKRACWQTSDSEIQGGFYLEPTSKPKGYDLATSTRTFEGIYVLEGGTLRLCYDLGADAKRPGSFLTKSGSRQVLVALKRIHGPQGFPFRLPDGTRAFPTIIGPRTSTPPPQPRPGQVHDDQTRFWLGLFH
jgi:RNA polymerase sigma factor (sigma-70 family)